LFEEIVALGTMTIDGSGVMDEKSKTVMPAKAGI